MARIYNASLSVQEKEVVVTPLVSSHTEWDPLEHVVVGVAEGTVFPREDRRMVAATMPEAHRDLFDGRKFPDSILQAATRELDGLAQLLSTEGVTVHRPSLVDWDGTSGYTGAMARDGLLVVGSTVVEAPMAWASRQGELRAYATLLERFRSNGAVRIKAPSHGCPEELLSRDVDQTVRNDPWAINDLVPAFDAADFLRFGTDIVGQLSNVTNPSGVRWLSNCLGEEYTVRIVEFDDPHAMHIDASIAPLRPGLMLYNPERVDPVVLQKGWFSGWELVPAPVPKPRRWPPLYMTSGWVNMNILVLDPCRVVVEEQDEDVAQLLRSFEFTVLTCPFQHVQSLGGSLHCATLDIRRTGALQTYLADGTDAVTEETARVSARDSSVEGAQDTFF